MGKRGSAKRRIEVLSPGSPGNWGGPFPRAMIIQNSFLGAREGRRLLLERNQGWREQGPHSWSWGDGGGQAVLDSPRILPGSRSNAQPEQLHKLANFTWARVWV